MNTTFEIVISGTTRPVDLLEAFSDKLEELSISKTHNNELISMARKYAHTLFIAEKNNFQPKGVFNDIVQDILEQLAYHLEMCAPQNMYFGVNTSNSSDFGFWPIPEDWENI